MKRFEIQQHVVHALAMLVASRWQPVVVILNKTTGVTRSLQGLTQLRFDTRAEAEALAEQVALRLSQTPESLPV